MGEGYSTIKLTIYKYRFTIDLLTICKAKVPHFARFAACKPPIGRIIDDYFTRL